MGIMVFIWKKSAITSKFVNSVLPMLRVQFHHDMMSFPFYWVDFQWKKDHDVQYFTTDILFIYFILFILFFFL